MTRIEEIEEIWDEGTESGLLDTGEVFQELLDHAYDLEDKLEAARKIIENLQGESIH
jgi:hypothetical protein